ncbi:MAG: AAA family ATPase [Bacteroides sp. SM23_62_1]|nr:MAG: AAA family ATPase [Bacteroides sp. SM23_62_1]
MNKGNILIIDDDPYILLSVTTLLEQYYSTVRSLKDPALIPSELSETAWDVILLDMNFKPGDTSGEEGLQWLEKMLTDAPSLNIIVITAYGDVDVAVRAMKLGAIDFIVKPWQNEKLVSTVSAAFKLSQSKKKVHQLQLQKSILSSTIDFQYSDIIGNSPAIKQVIKDIEKVAGTDVNVLILGENGTGKELVAREIHRKSERKEEVFVNVDLGSLSESLFESELFGHQKGAYTDATEDRVGRFEAASGGTLFLDEIGNLTLQLQSKLLSALQNRKIFRVGSNRSIEVDIRLICATNRSLKQMVSQGAFRQDLLYRINTVEIEIPPLRKRQEDIPMLANYYLSIFKRKYRKDKLKLPNEVIMRLQRYEWPGNIRELRHAIERAIIMSDGHALRQADFQFLVSEGSQEFVNDDYDLDNLEKWAIDSCLKKYGGNVSKAAIELGLTRGSLYRRMQKYGLQ